jgi:hypothetical protein
MRGKITKLRQELKDIIEPSIILLHELESSCNLQTRTILGCSTVPDKVDELLRWLVEDYRGDYKNVKEAFKKAGQKHIVNFINADGGISSLFLVMSDYSIRNLMKYILNFNTIPEHQKSSVHYWVIASGTQMWFA